MLHGDAIDGHSDSDINGEAASDASGTTSSSVGDINKDGFEDFVVGAPGHDNGATSNVGAAYVVFGNVSGLPANLNLSSLDGTNGFRLLGVTASDMAGSAVSGAGDVNNDGFSDLIVAATAASPSSRAGAGSAYVVFGAATFSASVSLGSLTGSNGFRLDGVAAGDALGSSVAKAGDVNKDGFADIVLGAPGADPNSLAGAGSAYVVFGKASFSSTVSLSGLTGTTGFQLNGAAAGDALGTSVGSAGDVNKDGYSDVILGAPDADPGSNTSAGSAYIFFGKASGFAGSTAVSTFNGTTGFVLTGIDAGDQTGKAVAGDGDINNDGYGDIIVGSPRARVNGVSIGAAYVFFGKASGFSASVAVSSLTGANGFRLAGDYQFDPLLSSFIVNTTGQKAWQVSGQNTSLVTDSLVDFTSVIPDATSVYVHSSGIPFLVLGSWPGNPGTAKDQNRTHQIPRVPVVKTGTKTKTALGSTGVWKDGVAIYNWSDGQSYNNQRVWNRNAMYWEGPGLDANGAHVPPTGEYHTHAAPTGLLATTLGDTGTGHSPLLGWAYDGFPIYGSRGYINADGTGGIARQTSSWRIRNITARTHLADGADVADGPTVASVPLGAYAEDFEYVNGLGTLDKYNGRFSVTPEYPEGLYHYVVSLDASGTAAFPYVIGLEYYGVVQTNNIASGGPGGGTITIPAPAAAAVSVAFAHDHTGDGHDDVAVGDPDAFVSGAGIAGAAYVYYGHAGAYSASFDLSLLNGTNGQRYNGLTNGSKLGTSVAFAGDVNKDGGADLLITAPGAAAVGLAAAGQTYLLSGAPAATLTVTLASNSISEKDGLTTLTVSRPSGLTTGALTVTLTSNDLTEATVPTTVTIADGQTTSSPVTVTAVDDTILDGTQTVTLTAAATGYSSGASNLSVTDYEPLQVSIADASIHEIDGQTTTTLIVTRTDTSAALTVTLLSSDTTEATIATSVLIAAGVASSNPVIVTGQLDNTVDGDQNITLTASATGYVSATTALKVIDDDIPPLPALTVTLAANSISEKDGLTTFTVSRPSGQTTGALTVTLTSDDLTEATVPTTVTIADGETTSSPVTVTAIDDTLLDGTQTITLTAAATGFTSGTSSLSVTDYEPLQVSIADSSIHEKNGQTTTTLIVTRTDTTAALTVTLLSSDTTEATIATSVVIPAGAASSSPVVVTGQQDNTVDSDQNITLTASATDYVIASTALKVIDDDVPPLPALTVTLAANSISEKDGLTTFTVSRPSGQTSGALTVTLTSNDLTEATVPTTVTIADGQTTSSPVTVTAVDDTILDGSQTVTLTAAATGYSSGTSNLSVTDYEPLQVSIADASIHEKNGQTTTTLIVTRTDTTAALTVTLLSSDTTEAIIATSVVIPAGVASSSPVVVTGQQDNIIDGDQNVTLTASATGYVIATASLNVIDDDVALAVPVVTAPPVITSSQRPTVSWTAVSGASQYVIYIRNDGLSTTAVLKVLTDLSFTPTADLGIGRYTVWVRAVDASGASSKYSDGQRFRISAAPVLTGNTRYNTDTTPTITWTGVSGAKVYDVWVDNLTTGQQQTARDQSHSGTTWTSPTEMQMGNYRIWVRGKDAAGLAAAWSIAFDFYVLPPVTATGPTGSILSRTPTFTWNAVPGASSYDFVLRDANTGMVVSNPTGVTGTSFTVPTALTIGKYRWYVFAVMAGNYRSQSATIQEIFVGGPPTLLSPSGSTTNTTPTFTWTPVIGAVNYKLFVSRLDLPRGGLINLSGLSGLSYTLPAALAKGTYRAWVQAVGTTASSLWSSPVDFVIVASTEPLLLFSESLLTAVPARDKLQSSSFPLRADSGPVPVEFEAAPQSDEVNMPGETTADPLQVASNTRGVRLNCVRSVEDFELETVMTELTDSDWLLKL